MNGIDWVSLLTTPFYLVLLYLTLANVIAFVLYGVDKLKAQRNWMRVSEFTLLMVAMLSGSLGALIGMNVWRHKTKHWKFTIGIPLVLLLQIALMVILYISSNQAAGL